MEFERRLNKNRESPRESQLRIGDNLSCSGNKSGHIQVKLVGPATESTLGVSFNIVPPTTISTPDQGVDVVQDQLKGAGEGSKTGKNLTGSSAAFALETGLAAMVIYCVKASILSMKTANQNEAAIHPIPDDRAIQVAKPDAMKRAFASLGSTSNKFIQVWEELDKVSVILERWEREKSIPEGNLKCTQEFMQFGIKLASPVKQSRI